MFRGLFAGLMVTLALTGCGSSFEPSSDPMSEGGAGSSSPATAGSHAGVGGQATGAGGVGAGAGMGSAGGSAGVAGSAAGVDQVIAVSAPPRGGSPPKLVSESSPIPAGYGRLELAFSFSPACDGATIRVQAGIGLLDGLDETIACPVTPIFMDLDGAELSASPAGIQVAFTLHNALQRDVLMGGTATVIPGAVVTVLASVTGSAGSMAMTVATSGN